MSDAVNLVSLIQEFGTDDHCRRRLAHLRWPLGVTCPRCDSKKVSYISTREVYDCDSCRYQFTATSGTIFHDSHLPLTKWFLATYVICESKKGISANQLGRMLGISYKTAWYLCHRIRKAMTETDPDLLSGTVECDAAHIGGHRRQIEDEDTKHETVNHRCEEWVRGDVHTNSMEGVWSLFKRSIVGSYHQVSGKHLDAYLDEFEWRFNQRENPYLFRDTLIRMIKSPKMEFRELIDKPA